MSNAKFELELIREPTRPRGGFGLRWVGGRWRSPSGEAERTAIIAKIPAAATIRR